MIVMTALDSQLIQTLSTEAKVLLFFHVYSVEWCLLGKPVNDDSTYCKKRDDFLKAISVPDSEVSQISFKYGGDRALMDYEDTLRKLANSLKKNAQRQFCRTQLWRLIDELEFDHLKSNPRNDELVYNYKWNLVNKILKDKLFG